MDADDGVVELPRLPLPHGQTALLQFAQLCSDLQELGLGWGPGTEGG